MKNINNITEKDLISLDGLLEAYRKYLKKVHKYSDFMADMVLVDMRNPYMCEYLKQNYKCDMEVGGIMYEVRSCKTEYRLVGLWEAAERKPFEFYMFIDKSDIGGSTVGEYSDARKMYVV